jgi:hypothetical protein
LLKGDAVQAIRGGGVDISARTVQSPPLDRRRSVLTEIHAPRPISPERVFEKLLLTPRAQVEPKRSSIAIIEVGLAGYLHFVNCIGDFLEVIGVEVFLVERFRVECWEDVQLHDETTVIQPLSADIAREVQHGS